MDVPGSMILPDVPTRYLDRHGLMVLLILADVPTLDVWDSTVLPHIPVTAGTRIQLRDTVCNCKFVSVTAFVE
jgi:hypothetical protein